MERDGGRKTYEVDETKGGLVALENKDTIFHKGKGSDSPKEDAWFQEINEAIVGTILLGQVILKFEVQTKHATI